MPKITRASDHGADRYKYDFKFCHFSKGWAQLDTKEDASYYGNWVNPITLELFSYVEGDTTHTQCENEEDFANTVRECVGYFREKELFIGIDGMCRSEIIEAFNRFGLGEMLH